MLVLFAVAPASVELDVSELRAEEAGSAVCRVAGGIPEAQILWTGPDQLDLEEVRVDQVLDSIFLH